MGVPGVKAVTGVTAFTASLPDKFLFGEIEGEQRDARMNKDKQSRESRYTRYSALEWQKS